MVTAPRKKESSNNKVVRKGAPTKILLWIGGRSFHGCIGLVLSHVNKKIKLIYRPEGWEDRAERALILTYKVLTEKTIRYKFI